MAARRRGSIEVDTADEVNAATSRLSELGLFTLVENDTECCYALQDKVWVHGPGREPWEVYTVKADAPDATSVHAPGQPDAGDCLCGTPTASSVDDAAADAKVSACC